MKMKQILIMALAMVLVASISVVATLAYLTDNETVTNTFTVGKLEISLDEKKVDEYGVEIAGADRVLNNTYKLLPGRQYTKDPMIHVKADSEDCWLFVKVKNDIYPIETTETGKTVHEQIVAAGWTAFTPTGVTENPGVKYYYTKHDKDLDPLKTDYDLFKTFAIRGEAHNIEPEQNTTDLLYINDYQDKTVEVTAYAIQTDGIADDAQTAWASGNFQ